APVFRLSSGWIAVSAVQTGDICRWHIGNNACSYAATLCALRPCAQISLRHFARAFLLRSCRVTVPPSPPSGTVLHSTSPTQDALHLSLTCFQQLRAALRFPQPWFSPSSTHASSIPACWSL